MKRTVQALLTDETGATMVEYAIMVSFIAAICVGIVSTLGKSVSNMFSSTNASI